MTIKVTMIMQQERRAWTESHYAIGAVGFTDVQLPAQNLALLRANLLGKNASLTGLRFSVVPANRQVVDSTATGYTGTWPADPSGTVYDSEFGNVALLLRFDGTPVGSGGGEAAPKSLYLAGIPASVIQVGGTGGRDYTLGSTFNTVLQDYGNYLAFAGQTYWGYRSRSNANTVQANGLVTNALTPVQIGVVAPTVPGVVQGSEVYLTGWRRVNSRLEGLSGPFVVASVTTVPGPPSISTYYLWNTGNVSPLNFVKPGFIAPLTYGFAAYQGWLPVKAVSRKRGGSIGLPRGRSRVRL